MMSSFEVIYWGPINLMRKLNIVWIGRLYMNSYSLFYMKTNYLKHLRMKVPLQFLNLTIGQGCISQNHRWFTNYGR